MSLCNNLRGWASSLDFRLSMIQNVMELLIPFTNANVIGTFFDENMLPLFLVCQQRFVSNVQRTRKRGIRGKSWKRGEREQDEEGEEGPNGQKVVWTVPHRVQ